MGSNGPLLNLLIGCHLAAIYRPGTNLRGYYFFDQQARLQL